MMLARVLLQQQQYGSDVIAVAAACGWHAAVNCVQKATGNTSSSSTRNLTAATTANGIFNDGHVPCNARRCFSSSGSSNERLVSGFVKELLGSLSIPHAELSQLLASGLSDAAVAAWALTKTASHPAEQQAAAASAKLQQLLAKLDAAMLWQQQAASSPLGQLLWQVAVRAAGQRYGTMQPEALQDLVEHQVVAAMMQSRTTQRSDTAGSQQVLAELQQQVPLLVDSSQLQVLQHPAFWQLAATAVLAAPSLAQDLQLLGYDLPAAVQAASLQLEQLQQLVGVEAAALQSSVITTQRLDGSLLLPDRTPELLAAVAGNKDARQKVAQLQLLQVLAQALGLSSVQLTSPASACELVQRLTGLVLVAEPGPSEALQQELAAAAPQLLAMVSELPASALGQPSVANLLQLMHSKEQLKELAERLTAWRAEAAAGGNLAVLTSLGQAEVTGLSQQQAEAVGRHAMQLEAAGRLLMRKAAAGQLLLGQLDAADAAALAWKLHGGGPALAQQLVQLMLNQAREGFSAAAAELDSAQQALSSLAAGFQLEEATSRLCTAAPPSPLVMAGVPQHQVAELSEALQVERPAAAGGAAPYPASSSTAEMLVRDLALLLSPPAGSSSSVLPGSPTHQAAVQRLQVIAHDLPKVLTGPLLELVNSHKPQAVTDAAAAQRQQQQLSTFLRVLAAELPRMAAQPSSSSSSGGAAGSDWAPAGSDAEAAEGLMELVGAAEAGEVLAHAAAGGAGGRGSRYRRDDQQEEAEEGGGLYEMLASIHHDIDTQRYLQMEFDPMLEMDVVHAPRGWREPDLFEGPSAFLEGMRPLLDAHLVAQGEQGLTDLEWQVYRDAALAEAEQVEASSAAAHRAAGHSPFHNSRADEAFLTQRLDEGIPKSSVLYAAAHKYLRASFKNRSWRFVQRKHLVDRLIEIAGHLAAHPTRTVRGSPFSALFQADAPPAVPRLSRAKWQQGSGGRPADDEAEVPALPAGFAAPGPTARQTSGVAK